jgi:hypothetical protein
MMVCRVWGLKQETPNPQDSLRYLTAVLGDKGYDSGDLVKHIESFFDVESVFLCKS